LQQSVHPLEALICQFVGHLLDAELAQLREHILLHTRARRGHAATCTKKNKAKKNLNSNPKKY
jgi:hypothetical protein